MLSYLSAEHAGQPDKNGQFKVLSTMELLPPGHICTETYLLAGWFDTETEAANLLTYLKTRFLQSLDRRGAICQIRPHRGGDRLYREHDQAHGVRW